MRVVWFLLWVAWMYACIYAAIESIRAEGSAALIAVYISAAALSFLNMITASREP